MARIKKELERAEHSIRIRVNQEQKSILVAGAARAGLGLSAWMRTLALKEARRLGVK
jgi:hypothetical protein